MMIKKKKKRQRPEHHEQVKIIRFLEKEKSYGRVLMFSATLNGVYLPQPYAAMMMAAGLRRGPSDLVILLPKAMLWVEVKLPHRRRKDGTLGTSPSTISDEQKQWIFLANTYDGVHATIAYGAEEAISFISSFIPDAGIYTISNKTNKERSESLGAFASFLDGKSEV